jgi:type I restriction enzyme S subunit
MSSANSTVTVWQTTRLGNVCQVKGGKRLPRGEKLLSEPTPYPYIRVCDFKDFSVELSDIHYLTPEIQEKISRYTITKNDVFISIAGTIGRVGVIPEELDGANLTENAARVVLRSDGPLEKEFLKYYLASPKSQNDISTRRSKNAQPKLSLAQIKDIEVPLPPLPEQKKIAHILSTVQRAIEAQERIIQTTTELKKALMHKLFTEGLRNEPQKQTEIGPIPEGWEVVPLSDVCRFQSGGTPSKKNPEFWQGTIPWVSPKDMKRPRLDDVADHISQEALESGSKLAPAGSVFVVVRGMILAKTVPVALAEVPMAINQDMKAIVPGPKLRSDFLLYALETLRGNLFKKVGRSGHGTATLMGHEVAAFKIPLPDLQAQKEIASAIQNLERKKELHERKKSQLQDLFCTLLHELMTAKTRVHDISLSKS